MHWSMMCLIVVRVTFMKNVLIDDVSYCGKSYINQKCFDAWWVVFSWELHYSEMFWWTMCRCVVRVTLITNVLIDDMLYCRRNNHHKMRSFIGHSLSYIWHADVINVLSYEGFLISLTVRQCLPLLQLLHGNYALFRPSRRVCCSPKSLVCEDTLYCSIQPRPKVRVT
jgi:hypothetical protein